MSRVELIDELTDICVKQAAIIRKQAFLIEQLGSQALEDPELAGRLQELVTQNYAAERGA